MSTALMLPITTTGCMSSVVSTRNELGPLKTAPTDIRSVFVALYDMNCSLTMFVMIGIEAPGLA